MKTLRCSKTLLGAAALTAAVVASACSSFRAMAWGTNERAKPIDDNAGETSLPAIFGERPVFYVDSVKVAPDIESALLAAASNGGGKVDRDALKQVTTQISDEAEQYLRGLAANSDAVVYTDRDRASKESTLQVHCTIDALRVEGTSSGASNEGPANMMRLVDASMLADARFVCVVTLTAMKDKSVIAMQRSEGIYEPDVRAPKEKENANASEASAPATAEQPESRKVELILSAPTKSAIKRALNGAWTELWSSYRERVDRAHKASEAYKVPSSGATSTSASSLHDQEGD
jgi:hypothetical protein